LGRQQACLAHRRTPGERAGVRGDMPESNTARI
jgi:hypothetical protein